MEMREFMKMNEELLKLYSIKRDQARLGEEQTGHNYWVGQIHAWDDAIKLLEDITDE